MLRNSEIIDPFVLSSSKHERNALISLAAATHFDCSLTLALSANGVYNTLFAREDRDVIRHAVTREAMSTYEGARDNRALVFGRARTGLGVRRSVNPK